MLRLRRLIKAVPLIAASLLLTLPADAAPMPTVQSAVMTGTGLPVTETGVSRRRPWWRSRHAR